MPHRIKYPLARLSPAKNELVVIEFTRENVEAFSIFSGGADRDLARKVAFPPRSKAAPCADWMKAIWPT